MGFIVVVEEMLNPAGKDPDCNFLRILLYEYIRRCVWSWGLGRMKQLDAKKEYIFVLNCQHWGLHWEYDAVSFYGQ